MDSISIDTMDLINDFVGEKSYMSMAPMSREWYKSSWVSSRPTLAIDEYTSIQKFSLYLGSFKSFSQIPASVATRSALVGKFGFLRYLIKGGGPINKMDIVVAATKGGHLRILKAIFKNASIFYKHARFKILFETVLNTAIENGHIHILTWLSEMFDTGDTFNIAVCRTASSIGRLDVFEWAALDPDRRYILDDDGDDEEDDDFCEMFDSYSKKVVSNAIEGGHLELLKYAVGEKACCHLVPNPFNGYDTDWTDKLEILEWLIEFDGLMYSWEECVGEFCFDAAYDGKLDLLKWAVEHGAEMDDEILSSAINGDQEEIIDWITQHINEN